MISDNMRNNLIGQFHEKSTVSAMLEVLGEELDEISEVLDDLRERRWIDTSEGVQLDGIGDIVGRDRILPNAIIIPFFGFKSQPNALTFGEGRFRRSGETSTESLTLTDAMYRPVLRAKIMKNVAQCTTNEMIRSLQTMLNVETVDVQDAGNAKVKIAIGRELTPADIILLKAYDLLIRTGGVGVRWIIAFHERFYFGFREQSGASGFGVGSFANTVDLGGLYNV